MKTFLVCSAAAVAIALMSLVAGKAAAADMSLTSQDILRTKDGVTFYIALPGVAEPVGFNLKVTVRDVSVPTKGYECPTSPMEAWRNATAEKARNALRLMLAKADTIQLKDVERSKTEYALTADLLINERDAGELLYLLGLGVPNKEAMALDWCHGVPET